MIVGDYRWLQVTHTIPSSRELGFGGLEGADTWSPSCWVLLWEHCPCRQIYRRFYGKSNLLWESHLLRRAPAQVKLSVQPEPAWCRHSKRFKGLTASDSNRPSVTCRKTGYGYRICTAKVYGASAQQTVGQDKPIQWLACYVKKMKTHTLTKTCMHYNKYFRFSCVWDRSGHKVTAWKTQPGARAATDTQEMANKNERNTSLEGLTVQFTVWTLCYSWLDGIQLSEKTTAKHQKDFKCRCSESTHKGSHHVLKDRKPHSQTIKILLEMFTLLRLRAWWSRQCMLKKSMKMAPWDCQRQTSHGQCPSVRKQKGIIF